jgi:hypothetical protein
VSNRVTSRVILTFESYHAVLSSIVGPGVNDGTAVEIIRVSKEAILASL